MATGDKIVNLDDLKAVHDFTQGQVSDLKSAFTIEEIKPINLLDMDACDTGYYWTDGHHDSTSYCHSGFIPVTPGKTYSYQYGATLRALANNRFIVFYGDDKTTVKGSDANKSSYVAPSGAAYLVISHNVSSVSSWSVSYPAVVEGTEILDYSEYFDPYTTNTLKDSANSPQTVQNTEDIADLYTAFAESKSAPNGRIMTFNLSSDNKTDSVDIQDMGYYRYSFFGIITTFGGVIIGRGWNGYMGGGIGVDDTNVYVYSGANTTPAYTYPHGISSFADYIGIVFSVNYGIRATVTVYTNGASFTKYDIPWDSRKGALYCRSIGTNVMTGCRLAYYCSKLETDTWLYGDSYFGWYDDKWTSYLIKNKYENYMLNGYPGRNSQMALLALNNDLTMAKPKRIIWCLGMNDGDNGAVNADWLSTLNSVITICTNNGIELILATIPNVETVDNSYKNAYVESLTDYRHIDFATAVGAHDDDVWYSGMLSNDGVHPAASGAIALYAAAVSAVPELLSDGTNATPLSMVAAN